MSRKFPSIEVGIGAIGTSLDSSSATLTNFRSEARHLFFDLSNEWLNEEVDHPPLWHTFYEDGEPEGLADAVLAFVEMMVDSQHNISVSLLFQALQNCLDYLGDNQVDGYFLSVGSFVNPVDDSLLWYWTDGERSLKRARFFIPDVRLGADLACLSRRQSNNTRVEISLLTPQKPGIEAQLAEVSEIFLEAITLEQPALINFAEADSTTVSSPASYIEIPQEVAELHLVGELPGLNPIYAGVAVRSVLEACYRAGISIPIQLAVKKRLS
ncbi:hypothetical protein [Boudabousia marimammalium]|uniref:Uncharacterized protein n=1 Tax=Boudabousia marimammalium TaxID=156892 RepID=A0A1Q5PSG9_9ACTO|nr:hypothetical protein [Boudabousia marimammalium]OKL50528.1 hypothetical protein BM477_00725 [Boudabousia marimammalium]